MSFARPRGLRAAATLRRRILRLALARRLAVARRASAMGEWTRAAAHWRILSRWHPERAAMTVQLAHALKEAGHKAAAARAYADAANLVPSDTDARAHLAGLHRSMGLHAEAGRVYAEILAIDPRNALALRALAELGLRRLIPASALDPAIAADRLARIEQAEHELEQLRAAFDQAVAPIEAYDEFRRSHPVPPPPDCLLTGRPGVAVMAQGATISMLKATLRGLTDQSVAPICVIVVDGVDPGHPVLSPGGYPFKLSTCEMTTAAGHFTDAPGLAVVMAGAILDPQAIAWFQAVDQTTSATLCYGDHDQAVTTGEGDVLFSAPTLFTLHDPIGLAASPEPPIAVYCAGSVFAQWATEAGPIGGREGLRRLTLTAAHAVHIPRRLASLYRLPAAAAPAAPLMSAVVTSPSSTNWRTKRATVSLADTSIAVIIPSRHQPGLLRTMIDSLLAQASFPDRVRLVVIDNRNMEPQSRSLLTELVQRGSAVVPFHEPFNWSRANNIGVRHCDATLLVFANDDMEMLTSGWDETLRSTLASRERTLVGAKLLYPDGTYQHTGIVFGVGHRGEIIHEAVGRPAIDPGPSGRWHHRRQCAAATGAFLACERSTFEAIGGFEERLAIAYNDIDFCLRTRRAGGVVIYEPQITLLHHESKTRGYNVSQEAVAWDEEERHLFKSRWSGIAPDPSVNPQWAVGGRPFDGLREPSMQNVTAWIARGNEETPWGV